MMTFGDHVRTTGGALKNWFIAQTQDALAVAALWLVGLLILRVPLWYVWVPAAFLMQYVPHYGPILSLIGPAIAAAVSGAGTDWDWLRLLYVLIVYVVIVIVDGLLLQQWLMKRSTKVPIWASIIVPIVMGFIIPFWGLLLAPPLLAVFFTYWNRRKAGQASNLKSM